MYNLIFVCGIAVDSVWLTCLSVVGCGRLLVSSSSKTTQIRHFEDSLLDSVLWGARLFPHYQLPSIRGAEGNELFIMKHSLTE